MKIVLDTNVIFAAFATRGLCDGLLAICIESHEIILSDFILAELRKHLAAKLRMPKADAAAIESLLRDSATIVVPATIDPRLCPDPDDLAVLGTAVAASADALVTGDAALLAMGSTHGVPILSPRGLYDRLR